MLLPFNTAWSCCETCDHWHGQRNLLPFALLARRDKYNCHIHGRNTRLDVAMCDSYRKWAQLTPDNGSWQLTAPDIACL
jgi:hypothetical protein